YTAQIKNNPKDYKTCLQLAALYKSISEYEKAIPLYKNVLSDFQNIDYEKALIYTSLGECYYYTNKLKKAKKAFDTAVSLNSNHLHAKFGLARTLLAKKKFNKAINMFNQIIELDNSFTGSYYYLGRLYQQKKNIEKANYYYRKTLSKDIYFVEARLPLGQNYEKLDLFEKAYKQFYRLKNVDKRNLIVKNHIDSIKPKLSKKEEEIIPAKKQKHFFKYKPVKNAKKIPVVRIGLNSTTYGKIKKVKSLSFRSNNNFYFTTKKGKRLLPGSKNTPYKIVIFQNKASILKFKK
ncbi:tetratricopeptide repeat protein, partial [bacterium]